MHVLSKALHDGVQQLLHSLMKLRSRQEDPAEGTILDIGQNNPSSNTGHAVGPQRKSAPAPTLRETRMNDVCLFSHREQIADLLE